MEYMFGFFLLRFALVLIAEIRCFIRIRNKSAWDELEYLQRDDAWVMMIDLRKWTFRQFYPFFAGK